MPEAMPEQKTKMSAGSENPNRAGTHWTQSLLGTCEMSMMSKPTPRKKSSRISRGRAGADLEIVTSFISASEQRGAQSDWSSNATPLPVEWEQLDPGVISR